MNDGSDEDPWERLRTTGWFGRAGWVVPYGLVLAGIVINLAVPRGTTVSATYAAAPLAAAALCSLRGTLAVSAVAMAMMSLNAFWWDRLSTSEALIRLATVVFVALLSLALNGALRHSVIRLASARQIAETAQIAVLPTPPARIDDLSVAVRYAAAYTGARIGGDLYAVQSTPYGARMVVGDVCGKGLSAVDAVTVVLGAFREAAERVPDLPEVADWIENALRREARQRAGPEQTEEFVTAVLAEVPAGGPDQLRIVNRGHPPPVLLLADGTVQPLEPGSYALPLGLAALSQEPQAGETVVPFPPAATLLLYTDGVTEARNSEGVFYDPVARLRGRRFPGPPALLDALLEDVEAHTEGRTADDMALLAIARDPAESRHESPALPG
ncbi:serine/threonine-protein phosphatase [Streptomyces sp. WAC 00631]|uniref:PP2C family protein-serine/threonine phosphatase n=1 Tax=unclassified Streptomyces TaxID=2593676 RepID=UPI000F7B0AA0|nr:MULTISPECIES: PP2C family protein-serine/threonine phosphatase [unclassified Streptomyces]MCC5033478.1 serine/threonine-protein phosphatase [Streptomyces sp. WAC 00631]MCC9741566.1 serine/threonine-protein phosphatase [Streptomyces sp. MNU89]